MKLLYIDLFCGAGGTSTGVEEAVWHNEQCAKVIACVNHDANAIASHAANHPEALHFTEDIRTLELSPLVAHTRKMQERYPDSKLVLWASLECTNFSKAKGGLPRDADSRTLAEHLFRYIDALNPDYIQIENVEEFMSWGDLDNNGKPISRDAGRCYRKWVGDVCNYGYHFEHRILNSADYGAYTSRRRFFGIFAKRNLPIVFPKPAYCKDGEETLFGKLKKWKPVRDVLDFSDEGESIFNRKKPLVEATLKRIYAGLVKFVAKDEEVFLVKYNSMSRQHKYVAPGVDSPCPVISTQGRLGVAFLSKYYGGNPKGKNISVAEPAGTVTTKDHHSFITAYYGNGNNHSIDAPAPTVTTKDRLSLVSPNFIVNEYSGGGQLSSIKDPCPAVLARPKQKIVSCQFLDQQFGQSKPSSIENPCGTITTHDKYSLVTCKRYYLMNPQYKSKGGSIDNPCFTLIARMDKMPPYLIETQTGRAVIVIYESDSPMTVKIKKFMAEYGIIDIKMRMLRIPELKRIMGFPSNYVLVGTQTEQKKFIGNAVEVNMARELCTALYSRLTECEHSKIAI